MQKAGVIIALCFSVVLMTVPVHAVELKVTGFFDNIIQTEQNISVADGDVTSNKDKVTFGSTRSRLFFNFIASDDLRGVFAMELDSIWGAPARDRLGSRCISPEQCGFRQGIDVNNFELKHLYADFRVPQLPLGNRFRIGGFPANATPLHSHLLYSMDAGGADVRLTLTPQVSLLLYYTQLEEDVERFPGSTKIGEDFITGATLMLKPLPGLDLHLLTVYGGLTAPFGGSLTGTGGPFRGITADARNVVTENRYYLGFDARYKLGNLSIEPNFIYLLGERKFCQPGSVIGGAVSNTIGGAPIGSPVACTSPAAGGVDEIDYNAFQTELVLQYTLGKWLFAGKFAYASGDDATDDLNNQGPGGGGRQDDINGFRPLGIDTFNRIGEWLDILGRGEQLGSRMLQSPFRAGEAGGLNRFGYVSGAGRVEYKLTDRLRLQGIVGTAFTAEKTACPAVQRTATVSAANPTGCASTPLNFTGNSKYMGTEVDVHLHYTILPGLVNSFGGGYAFMGDAFQIRNRNVQDAWVLQNRILYAF